MINPESLESARQEGYAAFFRAIESGDCPINGYDKQTQYELWCHWEYGFKIAESKHISGI
jgi:hypothetical protein